jgi:hypothetical protein
MRILLLALLCACGAGTPVPDPSAQDHDYADASCGDGGYGGGQEDLPDSGGVETPCGDISCAAGTYCVRQYPGIPDAGGPIPAPRDACITLPAGCTTCGGCPNEAALYCGGTPCSDIVNQPGSQFYDCMGA